MSQKNKLNDRFLSIPADFTWEELIKVLGFYEYTSITTGKTAGSRSRFVNPDGSIILLHKPHPANIVKKYAIRQIIDTLGVNEKNAIKDE